MLGGIPSARRKLARKKTADGKGADKGASRPRHRRTGRGFHTHKKGRREHAKLPLHAPQPRVWLASSSAHRERATHRTTRRPYDGIRFVGREVTSLRADDQGGRANPPTIVELPWAPRAQEREKRSSNGRRHFSSPLVFLIPTVHSEFRCEPGEPIERACRRRQQSSCSCERTDRGKSDPMRDPLAVVLRRRLAKSQLEHRRK